METTIVDRLWLWGHPAGSHNKGWGLPEPSSITVADAAAFMGLRNVMMVEYGGEPKPPLAPYAQELQGLERIIWSVAGAGTGRVEDLARNVENILSLRNIFRKVEGAICDDLFCSGADRQESRISFNDFRRCHHALRNAPFPVDLYAVIYDYQLQADVADYLVECEAVSFWTWEAANLDRLEENFARLESLAPAPRKVLGCYMYDYGAKAPMPADLMQRQCDIALDWLKLGRITDVIFLASCICDLPLDAVAVTRAFIDKHGGSSLH